MLRAALGAARRRGWSTEVVLADDAAGHEWLDVLRSDGTPVRLLPVDSRRRLRGDVASLAAEPGPTILHTHFTTFDVPAALAAAFRPDVQVVWHLHSPARRDLAGRLRNVVKFVAVGGRVDRILGVAPDVVDAARRRGARADRLLYFPNGIDTTAFRPAAPAEQAAARRALELDDGPPVLLHFGWDWKRKGGDIFLEAVRRLLDAGRPVTALSVGGGAQALELSERLELSRSLRVVPVGERSQTLYAAADLFVSPSRAEGMPFAMLEALASGVAVAASNIAGHAASGRGLGACRLTALEPEALAASIRALLDRDAAEVKRDAATARERIRAEYDLSAWAERLIALYEGLARAASTSET